MRTRTISKSYGERFKLIGIVREKNDFRFTSIPQYNTHLSFKQVCSMANIATNNVCFK